MAITMLLIFSLVLFLSPRYGILSTFLRRIKQRQTFEEQVLMGHIHHHAGTEREKTELARETLAQHVQWEEQRIVRVLSRLSSSEQVRSTEEGIVLLTEKGRIRVEKFQRNIFVQN